MNRRTIAGVPVPILLVVLTGVIAMTMSSTQPAFAGTSNECATVRMDAPFRLPDGLLYPAGSLTVCESRAFSPVDNLHKILVDGWSVGEFVSRRRSAELRSMSAPEFLFRRGVDGNLELVGYTVPRSGRTVAYRLKSLGVTTWQASAPLPVGGVAAAPVAAIVATAGTR
jgi:hypothetical protein